MRLKMNTMETDRLLLRPFQVGDAEDMFRNYCGDPEVTKYLTWPAYASVQGVHDRRVFMEEQYAKNAIWDWAIVLRDLGQVIGSIGVVEHNEKVSAVEIGYCVGRPWWRQGIMTEAFSAVIEYLFTQCGVNRIAARHDIRNPGSGAVMRKCGLRYEGTYRQADWNNQGLCDLDAYAILREDYL